MKAIQFQPGASLREKDAALETEVPTPSASGHDILVKIEAIGLNPVDTKVRPDADEPAATLGYDAAGTVVELGEDVSHFEIGDRVYYAGAINRPGSNAEYQLVDERIAAKRPTSLSAAAAAALPLTSLTAWEALFDRLGIDPNGSDAGKSLLLIGAAGGVGSIGIQLAKMAGLIVIATASRSESTEWCQSLGADYVINHRDDLQPQLQQLGYEEIDYIANLNNTDAYWETMGKIIAPQGRIVLIVEPSGALDFGGDYKRKSISIAWEFMFTRSLFTTDDIARQRQILSEVANLIDTGALKTTANETLHPINAENLINAHIAIESGTSIGKLVISGWDA